MKKNFKGISLVLSVLVVSVITAYTVLAWMEPGSTPPNGNADAPINTGSTAQTKNGTFNIKGGSIGLIDSGGVAYSETINGGTLFLNNNIGITNMAIGQNGNVGIGTVSPGAKLEVTGQIKVTGGSPAAGKVLTSDAAGLASWQAVGGALPSGTSGQTLRYDGTSWVANSNIFNNGTNVGIGTTTPTPYWAAAKALIVSDAVNNASLEVWGSRGAKSVFHSVNGNTYLGNYAKGTGSGNLYLGSGNFDWAISLLGSNGYAGIGTANPGARLEVAGQIKITGGSPAAGKVLTSDATGLATWQTPSGGIGGSGQANYVSKFTGASTLGNSQFFDNGTSIGIGTNNPKYKLDIRSGTETSQLHITKSGDDGLWIASEGYDNGFITAGGYWYNPTATPSAPGSGMMAVYNNAWELGGDQDWVALFANSGLTPGAFYDPTPRLAAWADGHISIGGSNTLTSPAITMSKSGVIKASSFSMMSDISLKKDIAPLGDSLDKIRKLQGVSFNWKDSGQPSIGFIAQDVERIFPEVVSTDKDTKLKSLDYAKLVAPLVEAVKEQQSQIENLKRQISTAGANKESQAQGLEIVDRKTGETYCLGIENGEWIKIKGECAK
jgi:ribosomal protein S6E (S10)